jgi:hypothetical protein
MATTTRPVTTTPMATTTRPVTTTPMASTTRPVTTTPMATTTRPVTTTPMATTTRPATIMQPLKEITIDGITIKYEDFKNFQLSKNESIFTKINNEVNKFKSGNSSCLESITNNMPQISNFYQQYFNYLMKNIYKYYTYTDAVFLDFNVIKDQTITVDKLNINPTSCINLLSDYTSFNISPSININNKNVILSESNIISNINLRNISISINISNIKTFMNSVSSIKNELSMNTKLLNECDMSNMNLAISEFIKYIMYFVQPNIQNNANIIMPTKIDDYNPKSFPIQNGNQYKILLNNKNFEINNSYFNNQYQNLIYLQLQIIHCKNLVKLNISVSSNQKYTSNIVNINNLQTFVDNIASSIIYNYNNIKSNLINSESKIINFNSMLALYAMKSSTNTMNNTPAPGYNSIFYTFNNMFSSIQSNTTPTEFKNNLGPIIGSLDYLIECYNSYLKYKFLLNTCKEYTDHINMILLDLYMLLNTIKNNNFLLNNLGTDIINKFTKIKDLLEKIKS